MGVIVLSNSVWALLQGSAPQGELMMGVASVALAANVISALLLLRHRQGMPIFVPPGCVRATMRWPIWRC